MLRGDDSHLVRVNTKINEVQTQALRPLIVQRNQWIAQITEKRAAMAQEEKARAALAQAKAAAGGEDPPAPPPTGSSNTPGAPPNPNPTSIPNSNLPPRSVPPPNALPTPAEPPRSSSGSTQSSAADSLDAAFAARPSTPLTNNHPAPPSSASSSSSVSPSTPSLGEQMTGPQPIIAGQAMGQQSLGISQLMQQHKQRQMQLAMNGMPQPSTPLTQQQLNHLQAMQQAQARLYAQQVPVQNGGPAPGLGAQNGASPHLSAAAIAGARSSPSMMHNAATSEMSPPHAHAIARPPSQQQNGNQIIAPQSNPGFPMPQYVYQQQLAHQAAQANGAVPSAPAPAQPTSAQMQFLAAAANPNHPAHLQYKQIMMQQINSVNAANGHGGPHPNGVPNGMLPQGHPQYAHLAQHGGMKVAPGMMPPQQPSHPQQPMQGQMWAAPTMPTPNAVNAAMQAAGIPTTTNMQLKLPPGRQPQPQPQQPQWHGTPMDKAAFLAAHGQGSLLGVESMGAPSQSPVIQHAAAIGSPMMTAARNYPRGVSGSPIMQPGASPVMDHQQHPHMMGTPQMMNRQQMAPSPLGGMPYQSPHLG
ncbi:hypothetical protein DL93DRAFT_1700803 [Clavulina sp. PMI_390]|nr:hypothetical protein DL93DRAFT_1700803 [Clavulina sp. PMI_390]